MVQRALSAHRAIGLLTAAILYLVCLTGTLSVFYEEWQRVEQPAAPEMHAITPDAVQSAVAHVLASEKDKPATEHLYVHMPVEALPRATVTTDTQAMHADSKGRIVMPEHNAWAEFLLLLHYSLNLPSVIGMTIVGALGVAMLALSLTGVIAHPRIFRDAFRLRARDKEGVGLADWHNRLGVWTLPFAIAIALTGAMIGLATINGYGLASTSYDGDMEAVYAPIFGAEGPPDARSAPIPDVAGPLRTMATRFSGARPIYVIVHDPLTAGQRVQIIARHDHRLIYCENYNFDGNGHFLGTTGLADGAIGQQFIASAYPLHFGNYGGLPVKLAYAVFGLALTAIVATGITIWIRKKERRGYPQPCIRNAWEGVVWGVPLALLVTFLVRQYIGNEAPFTVIFWLLSCAIVALATVLSDRLRIKSTLQMLISASGVAAILSSI